jgi:hypothetical protein
MWCYCRSTPTEGAIVPWYKCSACRIRRSGLDVLLSAAQDECPLCGRPLEPVVDGLASLMGHRLLTGPLPLPSGAEQPDSLPGQDAMAAARWLDEGGSGECER